MYYAWPEARIRREGGATRACGAKQLAQIAFCSASLIFMPLAAEADPAYDHG